ncbi:glycine-rich cell wall structural protein 2-like [Limulus polyphemus]|uniref:Glycine-rich cell wall structural protein 2-like n=1 Tax=Limulus polyphemus TaxID=6850 RepID=A0ABM1BPE1_LIMPO|nr:glycine-rich cell wall structural protein 2-like [Limulus polyphemus]
MLAAAAYAGVPAYYAHGPALVAHGAYGAGYGGHGYLNSAAGAAGYGALAAHSRYGQAAYGAAGLKANAARRNLNAYGAVGAAGARYHDQGAYARNKGSGYEKAYNYDKQAGYHNIGGAQAAYGSAAGLSDKSASSNLNAYGRYGHGAYGAKGLSAAHGYGAYGKLSAGHAQVGGAYGSGYLNVPGYSGLIFHQRATTVFSMEERTSLLTNSLTTFMFGEFVKPLRLWSKQVMSEEFPDAVFIPKRVC